MNHPTDPIIAFETLLALASVDAPSDHTVMSLATADASGRPSVRVVLLHGFDARGFVFFTNYDSRKGRELTSNPMAALAFYWPWLDEQVRAEGAIERIAEAESDIYFASRPRGKQIGAWASDQSRPLRDRAELDARCAAVELRFAGQEVPRPPFWGGFRLVPDRIEFWKARADRLHDRFVYTRSDGAWQGARLFP